MRVENMLTRSPKVIRQANQAGIREVARFSAKTYLNYIMYHSMSRKTGMNITPWRGYTLNSLAMQLMSPKRHSVNNYYVTVPEYIMRLDAQKTHAVALKQGRTITKWAQEKLGINKGSIWVSGHPFIEAANFTIIRNVLPIMNRNLDLRMQTMV